MVRLKEELSSFVLFYCKFQFHYGTIKRNNTNITNNRTTTFQFHYGTIKRMSILLDLM